MIVGVHPLAGFDKVLHYYVPEALRASMSVGSLVRIPVGRVARLGVVGALGPPSDFPVDRLKPVLEVIHPFPALTTDLLDLARWMAVYYAAPMDTVIEAMIPAAVRRGARIKEQRMLRVAREDVARGIRRARAQGAGAGPALRLSRGPARAAAQGARPRAHRRFGRVAARAR